MALTYRAFVERVLRQRIARSDPGRRLFGTVGILLDALSEGAEQALRATWIADSLGPAADGLSPAGEELSLPRYPQETPQAYESRLARAWTDWQVAGDEASVTAQLTAAGFPGAEIYYASPLDAHWSKFFVFYPSGTHTVTSAGPGWGSFTWGDGTTFGPIGISAEDLRALRKIILKFKPGHWICGGLIFEISGWSYGTGPSWGDPGLVWGGTQAVVGVP
jgi:hypothetical protein